LTIQGGGAFNLPTVEAVAYSLFDLSAKTVDKLILSKNLYVSNTKGNDSTAIIGNPHRSYKTIEAAVSAATFGDLVYVFKDDYVVNSNLWKNGISIYFEHDTNVSATTSLFLYNPVSLPSENYGMNILGGGNFHITNGNFYYHSVAAAYNFPIPNINIEFNSIYTHTVGYNSITHSESVSIPNGCNVNIKGNYINSKRYCLYLQTPNTTVRINCDINMCENDNNTLETVYLNNGNGTNKPTIYTKINTIVNNNVNGTCLNMNGCKVDSTYINNNVIITGCYNVLNCNSIGGTLTILTTDHIAQNEINCGTIANIVDNTNYGKTLIYSNIGNLIKNGNGELSIYDTYVSNSSTWIFNSGLTNIYGNITFINNGGWNDKFQLLGNCTVKVYNDVIYNYSSGSYSNIPIFLINHPNAVLDIKNSIYNKNVSTILHIINGKCIVRGDLEMLDFDSSFITSQAILYEGGELVLNNTTIKTILGTEQYPISNISTLKDVKILSGGLTVNRETFDARKQKINVVVGGTVLSSETYTLTLSGINYNTSGHTTDSEVVSGFTSILSSLTDFTVVNNDSSFTVECNIPSVTFVYGTSKTIGSGTISNVLIQYATYSIQNNIGGTIIIDSDV